VPRSFAQSAPVPIDLARVSASAILAASLASCAGGMTRDDRRPSLSDDRPLITAGPRCTNGVCRCRDAGPSGASASADDARDVAPEGQKRFELRTGRGGDDVQITVEGRGTLHKSGDADMTCGYVDLPPGEHRVRLRVKAPAGQTAAPRLLIYEHGDKTHSWYETFAMACGTGAVCTRPELEDRLAELHKPRGLFDPCGSVKVTNIRHASARDGEDRVTELDLEAVLKVYAFTPRFPHGGTCKGLSPTE
jgi:hypothetical protein